MLFSCSSCATKYKLPDEKIAGKVLKIRCKKCSSVIVVRDPKLVSQKAMAAAKAVAPAAPAPPAPVEQPVWFVGIDGQQQGPMTLSRLAALADAQKVTLRSYVWRAGMADWVRAGDLPELVERLDANAKAVQAAKVRAQAAEAQANQEASARADAAKAEAEEAAAAARAEAERAAAKAEAERAATALAEAERTALAQAQATALAEAEHTAAQAVAAAQATEDAGIAADALRAKNESEAAKAEEEAAERRADAAKTEVAARAALDRGPAGDPEEIGAATLVERSIPSGLLADLADINAAMDAADAADAPAAKAAPAPSALPELPALPPIPAAPEIPAFEPAVPAVPATLSTPEHGLGEASLVFGDGVDPAAAAALENTDFDDFFDAAPAPAPTDNDIFGDFDAAPEKVSKDDKAYFKQQMKEAAAALDDLDFGSDPMPDKDSLRQEFSLLIRLDKQKKKSYVWVALAAVAVVALVAVGIVLVSQQSEESEKRTRSLKSDGDEIVAAEFNAKYESLIREVESEDAELADELKAELKTAKIKSAAEFEAMRKTVAARRKARIQRAKKKKVGTSVSYTAPKTKKAVPARKLTDAERIALLSGDKDEGGRKPALNTSAIKDKQAALQAEIAGQKKKAATEGQAKLKKAFKAKVRQFARCKKPGEEDKLIVTFKLSASGRVETCKVGGTKNTEKSTCVMGIMKRALFPDGAAGTYRQTITL